MSELLDELLARPTFEGALEPINPPGKQRSGQPADVPALDPADLPVVSIGTPYAELINQPAGYQLASTSMFLVVMACSFRPVAQDVSVTWARFAAKLLPDERSNQPLVHASYPDKVEKEVKVTTKLGLSPTLGFDPLEISIGEFSRVLEYPRVEPLISASGQLEDTASWDFFAATGSQLGGGKLLCALVKAPASIKRLTVSVGLSADLKYHGLKLPAWLGGDPRTTKIPALDITVWRR